MNNIPGISAELWLRSRLNASNPMINDFHGVIPSEARDLTQPIPYRLICVAHTSIVRPFQGIDSEPGSG